VFLIAMIALAVFVFPSWLGLVAIATGIVVEVAEVAFGIKFLRRYRVRTGAEGLIGEIAEVIEDCDPRGRVRLRGEIWQARSTSTVRVGERVTVASVDGLTLEVEPNGKGPR
jgi:membrane-bound serine protease (ClpP class)